MKILLTGGSGFIGRNILEKLGKKYRFYAPSHKELPVENYWKLTKYLGKNKIDIVIHSAVYQGPDEFEINIRMFLNLVKNIKTLKKLIVFGSGAEYSKTRHLIKVKEDEFGKHIPQDKYGLYKYVSSLLSEKHKKIITFRLFGVYGKYEDYRKKFISNTIIKSLLGLPIKIKQNVIFDYLFVNDLVNIVDLFLSHKAEFNTYNLTPTNSISLKNIAGLINQISAKKSVITVVNKGMNYQYSGSNHRLLQTFPGFKFTGYKNGIKNLFQYYKSILHTVESGAIIKDDYFLKSKIKQLDGQKATKQ